jgi:hypothetical protein
MDHTPPVIGYQPGDGRTHWRVPAWLIVMLVLGGWLGLMLLGGRFTRFPKATPKEIADAQAAFERADRARGESFTRLVTLLDQNGRGLLTEQELVQRLGPPDGQVIVGPGKELVYYYDRFGTRDEVVMAELSGGVLVHFAYTDASQWPSSQLQPYPLPATAPYHAGAEHAR